MEQESSILVVYKAALIVVSLSLYLPTYLPTYLPQQGPTLTDQELFAEMSRRHVRMGRKKGGGKVGR